MVRMYHGLLIHSADKGHCAHFPFSLFLLSTYVEVGLLGPMYVYKSLPNCSPKWLHHFAFLPSVFESSSWSILLPGLIPVILNLRKFKTSDSLSAREITCPHLGPLICKELGNIT